MECYLLLLLSPRLALGNILIFLSSHARCDAEGGREGGREKDESALHLSSLALVPLVKDRNKRRRNDPRERGGKGAKEGREGGREGQAYLCAGKTCVMPFLGKV